MVEEGVVVVWEAVEGMVEKGEVEGLGVEGVVLE